MEDMLGKDPSKFDYKNLTGTITDKGQMAFLKYMTSTKPEFIEKEVDDYFNLKMFQPLYSSLHNYYNINGVEESKVSYLSCLDITNEKLLGGNESL
jgi:hypothetical protein